MTIYLDIILLENIIMNYIILVATGIINKEKINYLRIFLSSLLGAIYAVITILNILAIYSNIILKIILSIIMIYIAFWPDKIKKLVKQVLIFYLTSFVFGGAAFFLLYIVRPQEILIKNGVYIGTYPLKIALLGGIVGFTVIIIAFKVIKGKITKKDMFCTIKITYQKNQTTVKAMIDTGNLLKEPITGAAVIVVEKEKLKEIIPNEILENIQKIMGGDYQTQNQEENIKIISKFRVIPYSSLGKENGMLLGFKADYVEILTEETTQKTNNIIIGIYDKKLTKNNLYQALIGLDVLEGSKNKNGYIENVKV